jgi:hypothetical protein
MRSHIKTALLLSYFGTLLAGAAFADEGVQVKITNDGTEDILVTVYDMNSVPKRTVLTNVRVNGFTSVPISLIGDANGKAHLSWTATTTDPVSPKCGQAANIVGNSDSVSVHADSACSV